MNNTNNGMYANYEVKQEGYTQETMMNTGNNCAMNGVTLPPIIECPSERCIHREIVHHVPHVCPINTRIINHHIYKHTYEPCYTCTEENEVCNVTENCCNKF